MSLLENSSLWNTLQGLRKKQVGEGQGTGDHAQSHRLPFALRARMIPARLRAEIYQLCGDLLETGLDLGQVYGVVADTMAARKKRMAAGLLREMAEGLSASQGDALLLAFAHGPERVLFANVSRSEGGRIFQGAARVLRVDQKIKAAIWSAVAGPLFLFAALGVLMLVMGATVFPAFETVTPRDDWPSIAKFISAIAYGISDWAIWLGGLLAILFIAITAALPLIPAVEGWQAPLRQFLDRFPPFSLYRILTGASFLFATLEVGRAGGTLTPETLRKISDTSSAYTRAFVNLIAETLWRGDNFAKAVTAAGHWPDRELNSVLGALSTQSDGLERFRKYLDGWLEAIESLVAARARALNIALLMLIATIIAGSASALFGIITTL